MERAIDITVEYTPPAMPVVTLTPDKETAGFGDRYLQPAANRHRAQCHEVRYLGVEQGGEWIKLANLLSE